MRNNQSNLSSARRELSEVGLDTTGEEADVPKGFIRIYPFQREEYEKARHLVIEHEILCKGIMITATLVKFGSPNEVANVVSKQELYPRP